MLSVRTHLRDLQEWFRCPLDRDTCGVHVLGHRSADASLCSFQVKFSELTIDMFRMLQALEREPVNLATQTSKQGVLVSDCTCLRRPQSGTRLRLSRYLRHVGLICCSSLSVQTLEPPGNLHPSLCQREFCLF